MGMYTWLTQHEISDTFTKLTDTELNELLQEVRENMPGVFVSEKVSIRKRIFKPNQVDVSYSVYHESGLPEVRCINLNFNTKALLYNYLCGLINGYYCFKMPLY